MALRAAAAPITRSRRSAQPLSNSWLPTAETSRSSAFITSMVGWSSWIAEANSEAPMRSPAPTIRVLAAGRLGGDAGLPEAQAARPTTPHALRERLRGLADGRHGPLH